MKYPPESLMDTLNRFKVVPVTTAPIGSVLPTPLQTYTGSGGPTASHRKVTSCPKDTVMSEGVTVNSGGPEQWGRRYVYDSIMNASIATGFCIKFNKL